MFFGMFLWGRRQMIIFLCCTNDVFCLQHKKRFGNYKTTDLFRAIEILHTLGTVSEVKNGLLNPVDKTIIAHICISSFLQDKKPVVGRKNPPSRPIGMLIKVQPQAKKAKMDPAVPDETPNVAKVFTNDKKGPPESPKVSSKVSVSTVEADNGKSNMSAFVATSGLVSYSDESEDDE